MAGTSFKLLTWLVWFSPFPAGWGHQLCAVWVLMWQKSQKTPQHSCWPLFSLGLVYWGSSLCQSISEEIKEQLFWRLKYMFSIFKESNFPSNKEKNIFFIKKKSSGRSVPKGELHAGALGNIKFWTVPPKGFLISSSHVAARKDSQMWKWLRGKSLECPECFALFQFFFHRNDHICLWILEIFLFIYPV